MLKNRLQAGGIADLRQSLPNLHIEKKQDDDLGDDLNNLLISKVVAKVQKKKPKLKAFNNPFAQNAPTEVKMIPEVNKIEELSLKSGQSSLKETNIIEQLSIEKPKEEVVVEKQAPKKNLFAMDEKDSNELEEKPVDKKPVKKAIVKKSLKNIFEDD